MDKSCQNIYQKARNIASLTQEKASELLFISLKTLANYESGRIVPPCETVCNMVDIYGTTWLAYEHLQASSQVASKYLPNIELVDLPRSVLQLKKELSDVVNVKSTIVEVAMTGQVDEHEEETWEEIIKEVGEMVGAGLGLIFYRK